MPLSKARMRERKRQDRLNVKPMSNLSPVIDVKPNQVKLEALRGLIKGFETRSNVQEMHNTPEVQPQPHTEYIPWYDRRKHKTGDVVKMRDASGRGQVVTVPEMDADGIPLKEW